MSESLQVSAEARDDTGKGASRRLRRQGFVPGIVYGASAEPARIKVIHSELEQLLENETFFSSLLDLKVDGGTTKVVLKDLQRHPAKPFILHVDFQRVSRDEKLRLTVPLHFENEKTCEGVKQGGVVSHNVTEIEVSCLPANLPEFIAVDMSGMDMGDMRQVSDLVLPEGVELTHSLDLDTPVVMIHAPQTELAEEEDAELGEADASGAPESDAAEPDTDDT